MKKLFAVLLALTLVLSMGTMALAADGKITINNAMDGAKYDIYKMLNFVASKTDDEGVATAGIYTIVDGWAEFFNEEPATNYFTVTTNADQTTVTLKKDVTAVDQTLAKAAIAYAEENTIAATKTATASGEKVEFTGLDLGYYAIDTSLGTMCALTNTNSTFTATEKNEKPDIDKFVQEDSEMNQADEGWGKVNDADIDQKVNYKSTITVGYGATNYVMHDTMEAGLTFNNDVTVVASDGSTPVFTVNEGGDCCTFEVVFDNDYIAGLAKGTTLTVYYSATLNENAKIVDDGNDNTVYLSYGEDSKWETNEHKTTTYTWKIGVEKFTGKGDDRINLAGAKFQLLGKDGKAIKFKEVTGEAVPKYKVDAEGTIDTIATDANGKFEIVGLDEGSYALHETEAPAGYNKLDKDIAVVITSTYNEEDLEASYSYTPNQNAEGYIDVENNTGSLLPETGGIGTTIFYVVGGLLMAAAFILLVSKKRMATFA